MELAALTDRHHHPPMARCVVGWKESRDEEGAQILACGTLRTERRSIPSQRLSALRGAVRIRPEPPNVPNVRTVAVVALIAPEPALADVPGPPTFP
jgi:hypothetical protein